MIYLDYAANTPVDERVLDTFCEMTKKYFANPNSSHPLGIEAKNQLNIETERIASLLGVKAEEIIYTSGASESNNLAIKGLTRTYRHNGKHIISTALEHSSVSGTLTYLQTQGYEIDLLDIKEDGQVDLSQLKELLRPDTVLVTIGYVDSELGVVQPIEKIADILKDYPNCMFHTDATQAVGKIPVHMEGVDCLAFTPHKFNGINGFGVLIKKEGVVLEPLIHGGASTTIYRSGTPVLPMVAATREALEIVMDQMKERYDVIASLKEQLVEKLTAYPLVRINSTKYSIPYHLNLSVKGVKARIFQETLAEHEVYVSTKSACSVPNTPSRAVYSVTKDRKNAMCSWRISISQMTTTEEIDEFINIFDICYQQLTKKG